MNLDQHYKKLRALAYEAENDFEYMLTALQLIAELSSNVTNDNVHARIGEISGLAKIASTREEFRKDSE